MVTGPPGSGTECANVASNTVRGSAEPKTKRPRRPCTEAVEMTSRFFSTVKARLTSSPCGALLHGRLTHDAQRSEEHTSELQSQSNLVCRLLLEKKKKKHKNKE